MVLYKCFGACTCTYIIYLYLYLLVIHINQLLIHPSVSASPSLNVSFARATLTGSSHKKIMILLILPKYKHFLSTWDYGNASLQSPLYNISPNFWTKDMREIVELFKKISRCPFLGASLFTSLLSRIFILKFFHHHSWPMSLQGLEHSL